MVVWRKAARTTDLPPGSARVIELDGASIALYNVEGRFYATDNACPHQGGPLGEGDLMGTVVTCPWHQWQFDVSTGDAVSPRGQSVPTYEVRTEGEDVLIKLGGPTTGGS